MLSISTSVASIHPSPWWRSCRRSTAARSIPSLSRTSIGNRSSSIRSSMIGDGATSSSNPPAGARTARTGSCSAKSRLLPRSIPFRFFAAAAVFQVMMWLGLFIGASEAVDFRGGLGTTLASVHLLTLGVLTTTAIGASVQLLPVATRRTLHAVWPIKLIFWLTVPGLIALVAGIQTAQTNILIPAAATTAAGLLLFCGLLADNLRRASSLPVVGAYGWAALVMLVLVIALGVTLAFNEEAGFLPDHGAVALAHLILGGFGFMGLLALGFSHVLIPMFALASAPPKRPSYISFAAAVGALLSGTIGALADSRSLLTIALV